MASTAHASFPSSVAAPAPVAAAAAAAASASSAALAPFPAVPRNVARASTAGADDVVGDVGPVGALPRLVAWRPTVGAAGASQEVVLTQGAVEQGQLAQLHAAQVVLALGHFHTLPDYLLDPVYGFAHILLARSCDESMQRFVFTRQWLAILATHFAFLDGALAPNDDLGSRFLFQGLERVAPWADQQADKVDVWVLLLRDHHFFAHTDQRGFVI